MPKVKLFTAYSIGLIALTSPTPSALAWAEGIIVRMECGEAGVVSAIYRYEIPGGYGTSYTADIEAPSINANIRSAKGTATVQGIFEVTGGGYGFMHKGKTASNPGGLYIFKTPTRQYKCNPIN